MKLAEALQERSDLHQKIERLRIRLINNAITQEGEKPVENPVELKKELDECVKHFEDMIGRINLTNCKTMIEDKTLTEVIAKKDSLLLKVSVYRDVIDSASRTASRARNTEIKVFPTVSVAKLQEEVDALAKEIRILDNRLQETNWKTELL